MLAQATSRLSSDPKYSAGSDIVLMVVLGPTVPPGAPDATGHCEFCRGDGNIWNKNDQMVQGF